MVKLGTLNGICSTGVLCFPFSLMLDEMERLVIPTRLLRVAIQVFNAMLGSGI